MGVDICDICMCLFVSVCMYLCACTCVHVPVCMYLCACVHVPVCMYLCACTCLHVPVCMYLCACTCVHVHTCIQTYIHLYVLIDSTVHYTHTHAYAHRDIRMYVHVSFDSL